MLLVSFALAATPPTFSVERGLYEDPFTVELTAADPIAYSLDGSVPSIPYAGPIPIDGTTVLRAATHAGDGTWSTVVTQTYLFPAQVPTQAGMDPLIVDDAEYGPMIDHTLRALPTVSVVLPGSLTMTEQAVSVEWIDPDGETTQVDCGAEIIGGTSYVYDKSSVRLHFRSEYGAGQWKADLYGDYPVGVAPAQSFDALTLRSGNHDSVFYLGAQGQYTRNYWMDETQLEMGHLDAHGRYIHVYYNGDYRGLYHLRERFDAGFLAEYLGGEEEDYEAINGGTPFDGSGAAWNQVVANASNFQGIQDWLNVPNFLDYMVLNYYAANAWDWSSDHNWIAAGPTQPGKGGFIFHNGDSDIVLSYDPSTNILSNGGPSNVFYYLLAEQDPDFLVALEDAIHRNLEDDGPLTAENARARYQRIADSAEEGIVAESARWGGGWWDHDEEWVTERDWLLDTFLAQRTDVLLDQVRAAGWYPLGAPTIDTASGVVPPGTSVSVFGIEEADLWVTTDGEDPRMPGGAVYAGATGPDIDQAITVGHGTTIKARLKRGGTWGPLAERVYEADEAPPIVLNEWNAVEPDEELADGDDALGTLPGNGGDWIELVVVEDHLDLRGWSLVSMDRSAVEHRLTFTSEPVLADLRAGTIITVAADLPEDASYDPERGDWRFHLRTDGAYVTGDPLDVGAHEWQLSIVDADGTTRVGAVGEGANPATGISGDEVGWLADTPGADYRRWSATYKDGKASTFGEENDGQDLSALRGEPSMPLGSGDTAWRAPVAEADAQSCGCGNGAGALWTGLIAILALRRRSALVLLAGCATETVDSQPVAPAADCFSDRDRDGFGDPAEPVICGGAAVNDATDCAPLDYFVNPDAPELCDGEDQDCDGTIDEDPLDGLPFYLDEDGDGYGVGVASACTLETGYALAGGDCDDADAEIHPDAVEHCDDLDEDCDGLAGDAVGVSSECPATSCRAIAEAGGSGDGAYFLALPSGTVTAVWCDLTTDGGGWTLGFSRNTASTGSQGDFGAGEVGLTELALSPEEASTSATPVLSWVDLNRFEFDDLRLAAYSGGGQTYLSRDIPKSELRIAFGEDGYKLYGGSTGYYWCGGDASYTDAGVGAVNNPPGAYADCKGHGSLGSGWDFSEADYGNAGLTLCGGDGSYFLAASWGGSWTYYGAPGASQAIWVR